MTYGPERIVFIRHAMPHVDSSIDPGAWMLSDEGAAAARTMRTRVDEAMTIASSPERKSIETVALATDRSTHAIRVFEGFREIDRDESVSPDFREARRAWIAGDRDHRHSSWESSKAASERFSAALSQITTDTAIIGTHGMVLTNWLVSIGLLPTGRTAVEFWEQLSFPTEVRIRRNPQPMWW